MKDYLSQIYKDVKVNLENYWPGFNAVPFALYDQSNTYVFNHPSFKHHQQDQFQILNRDDQFNGCTLIMFEGYPTAIVDLELYDKYEEVYSILVHELFHGFQYVQGERRFPDEVKGITYPLSKENVEWRHQERSNLFHALLEKNTVKKKQYLTAFVAFREKRSIHLLDYLVYETFTETVEGPAWYVEFKGYMEKSRLSYHSVLQKYGENLINSYESNANIRRSCYSSGLFLCLLLDELSPGWKEQFFETEVTLYDLVKMLVDDKLHTSIEDTDISKETEDVIKLTLEERTKQFEKFNEQDDIELHIVGQILATAFDPMNIIPLEDRLLHKNFIKIRMNDQEYLLQQPVIGYWNGRIQNIHTLHLTLKTKPIEQNDSLIIAGVGEIKGKYLKQGNRYQLFID